MEFWINANYLLNIRNGIDISSDKHECLRLFDNDNNSTNIHPYLSLWNVHPWHRYHFTRKRSFIKRRWMQRKKNDWKSECEQYPLGASPCLQFIVQRLTQRISSLMHWTKRPLCITIFGYLLSFFLSSHFQLSWCLVIFYQWIFYQIFRDDVIVCPHKMCRDFRSLPYNGEFKFLDLMPFATGHTFAVCVCVRSSISLFDAIQLKRIAVSLACNRPANAIRSSYFGQHPLWHCCCSISPSPSDIISTTPHQPANKSDVSATS